MFLTLRRTPPQNFYRESCVILQKKGKLVNGCFPILPTRYYRKKIIDFEDFRRDQLYSANSANKINEALFFPNSK